MNSKPQTIKDLHIKVRFLTARNELKDAMIKILTDSTKPKGVKHGTRKTH